MTNAQIDACSESLQRLFRAHPLYQQAKSIYGYLPYNQEVRTVPMLRQAQLDGKARRRAEGVWRYDEISVAGRLKCRRAGAYNIPEPIADGPEADDETALVLMPGLAFDPEGHRCGYGGGFYDKFLAAHPAHPTLALCYGFSDVRPSGNGRL